MDTDIEALLARMTLDEKLAQLGCVWCTALVEDDGTTLFHTRTQAFTRGKSGVVKASGHAGKTGGVKKVSTAADSSAAKSPKAAAPSRQKTAANAKKGKQ